MPSPCRQPAHGSRPKDGPVHSLVLAPQVEDGFHQRAREDEEPFCGAGGHRVCRAWLKQ